VVEGWVDLIAFSRAKVLGDWPTKIIVSKTVAACLPI